MEPFEGTVVYKGFDKRPFAFELSLSFDNGDIEEATMVSSLLFAQQKLPTMELRNARRKLTGGTSRRLIADHA